VAPLAGLAAGEGQPGLAGQYGAIFFDEGEGAALGSIVAAQIQYLLAAVDQHRLRLFKDVVKLRTLDASAESRRAALSTPRIMACMPCSRVSCSSRAIRSRSPCRASICSFNILALRRMRSWMTSQISDAASASINARNHQVW
jgi:hypothetical protein